LLHISHEKAPTKENCSKNFKDACENESLAQGKYFSTNRSSERVCNIVCSNSKRQDKCNDESDNQHPYLIMLEANVGEHFVMSELNARVDVQNALRSAQMSVKTPVWLFNSYSFFHQLPSLM